MTKTSRKTLTYSVMACLSLSAFMLGLVFLALMRPVTAQSPEPGEVPTTALTSLDPRWLQLVQRDESDAPKPGFGPEQAQSPQTLNVLLTDHSVAGRASNGSTVVITHMRGITVVASTSVRPILDGGSFFYATQLPNAAFCPPTYPCYEPGYMPGDVVQVSQGSSLLATTIPTFTALAYSKDDAIRGDAPASQTVSVLWSSGTNPDVSITRIVTASASGNYAANLAGAADVRARDSGFAWITTGANTTVARQFVAPFLRAQVGGLQISGLALPNRYVAIQVTDGTSTTRPGYGFAGPDGVFASFLFDGMSGLKAGDVVSATMETQSFSMTVEGISASISYSQAQVSGLAPANRRIEIEVLPGPVPEGFGFIGSYTPTNSVAVTTSATGQFAANVFVQASDYGYANLSDPEGHHSFARFVLPFMRARMGAPPFYNPSFADISPVIGQFQSFSTPVTLSIQSKRGYIKDIRLANAIPSTGFFMWPAFYEDTLYLQGLLVGGDVVAMASPLGAHMVFTLPTITAYANTDTDVVTGTAPPNSELIIYLGYGNTYPYPVPITPTPPVTVGPTATPSSGTPASGTPTPFATAVPQKAKQALAAGGVFGPNGYPPISALVDSQVITVGADGLFTATFANRTDIVFNTVGEVQWVSPEGFVALQPFRAQGNCIPQLSSVDLSRSTFVVNQQYGCPFYTIRLLDAADAEKGFAYVSGIFSGRLYQLSIQPNDTIELSGIGDVQRTRIPALSVALNPATDLLSATLLPNTEIAVSLENVSNFARGVYTVSAYFTATVGSNGLFTRSLSGTVDVVPSTIARVHLGERPTFIVEGVVPWMRTYLNQALIDIAIADSGSASVTVRPSGSITDIELGLLQYGGFTPHFQAYIGRQLLPGDHLTIKSKLQTVSQTLPALSAKLNVAKRMVTGMAPPNAPLLVVVYSYGVNGAANIPPPPFISQFVTATASGAFTATFTNTGTFASNAALYYLAPNGNEVVLNFGAPRWSVSIGERFVQAQSVSGSGLLSLTLRSAAGAIKSRIPVNVDSFGTFNALFTQEVEGGDRIELEVPGAPEVFVVPAYSAEIDSGRKLLRGVIEPNMLVQVSLPTLNGYVTRRVQTDAAGRFTLDIADVSLWDRGVGQIVTTDANGNEVRLTLKLSGYRNFFPVVMRQ